MGNIVIYAMGIIFFSFLLIVTWQTFKKDKKEQLSEDVVLFSSNEEMKIFEGKIKYITTDKGKMYEDLDIIVYDDGVFIGYANQAYPFFYLEANEVQKAIDRQGKTFVYTTKAYSGPKTFEIALSKGETSALTRKITFILERALKSIKMG
ncbi:MAG TPA: hypothetical protein VLA13_04505 [Massilibacterium sp.]|nr:hypothetical protein [Massilibacterium sp.]